MAEAHLGRTDNVVHQSIAMAAVAVTGAQNRGQDNQEAKAGQQSGQGGYLHLHLFHGWVVLSRAVWSGMVTWPREVGSEAHGTEENGKEAMAGIILWS